MLESQLVVAFVMNGNSKPPMSQGRLMVRHAFLLTLLDSTYQLFIIPVAFQYISRG